jgi:enediyne biosynthesis protein E4
MQMFDGVGRRRDQSAGQLVSIGQNSLNGNERDCLFRNDGNGGFTDVAWVDAADRVEDGRGVAILDYDQDGQPDIVLRNYRQPAILLRNAGGDAHWLELKLVGTRSNRDAVGARVVLTAGGAHQTREVHAGSGYLSGSSLVVHFGLGDHAQADSLEVRWPSGERTVLTGVAADRQLVLYEGETEARPVTRWVVDRP